MPDPVSASEPDTTIGTILPFGGQMVPDEGEAVTAGAVLSMRMVSVLGASGLPAWSVAKNVIVLTPSAETTTVAAAPLTAAPPDCAPAML